MELGQAPTPEGPLDFIRRPEYVSPSALQAWRKDQEAYFLRYLVHDKPPQMAQTQPMSVGSAFDAFVKNFLHRLIFGDNHVESELFELRGLFERQVDECNWNFAWTAGETCFKRYAKSGALKDLVKMLDNATEIRMEFDEKQAIGKADNPVIILGKPDLDFITRDRIKVTLDWKVNGYCAKSGASPMAGYIELFNDQGRRLGHHKDCCIWQEKDFQLNSDPNIEELNMSWGLQLAAYGWITGVEVGDPLYVAVDQLVCAPGALRVAQHRCEISREFQLAAYDAFQELWDIVCSDHIFRDMSKQESLERSRILYRKAKAYIGDDANSQWLRDQAAKKRNGYF